MKPEVTHASQPKSGKRDLITLAIPARNEADKIARLEQVVTAWTRDLPYNFEFMVIDNCSSDATGTLVKALCARDPRWKYVRFSRNFTVEMSITAGYHFASGDAIIVLYSDLQDPPEVIPRFIEKWQEGYDVVYGVRTVRPGDPKCRNFAAKLAYRLIAASADVPIPPDSGDFRLISRRVRDALENVSEYNRYMRGLIAWLGFRQIGISYERQPRTAGTRTAPFWNIFFFTFKASTSFSLKPLRGFTLVGIATLIFSILATFLYAYLYLVGSAPPGITTLIILSFAAFGLNSLGFAVLADYIV